jgi:acyl carrier protein
MATDAAEPNGASSTVTRAVNRGWAGGSKGNLTLGPEWARNMFLRRVTDRQARIVAALRPHLSWAGPDEAFPLDVPLDELGLDSLQAIEAVLRLEEEFDVMFPDELLDARLFASIHALEGTIAAVAGAGPETASEAELAG